MWSFVACWLMSLEYFFSKWSFAIFASKIRWWDINRWDINRWHIGWCFIGWCFIRWRKICWSYIYRLVFDGTSNRLWVVSVTYLFCLYFTCKSFVFSLIFWIFWMYSFLEVFPISLFSFIFFKILMSINLLFLNT